MTDIQKQDLQFWFYNGFYVEKLSASEAFQKAVKEVGLSSSDAESYLREDGRLVPGSFEPREYSESVEDDLGQYLDFDWIGEILVHQAGLKGEDLYKALSCIFKLSPQESEEVFAEMVRSNDEDDEDLEE